MLKCQIQHIKPLAITIHRLNNETNIITHHAKKDFEITEIKINKMAIITIENSVKNSEVHASIKMPNRESLGNFKITEYYSIESAIAANPIGIAIEKQIDYTNGFGKKRWGYEYSFIDNSNCESYLTIGKWKAKGLENVLYKTGGSKQSLSYLEIPNISEKGNPNGDFTQYEIIDSYGEVKRLYIYSIGYLAEYLLYYSQFASWKELEMFSKIQVQQVQIDTLKQQNKNLLEKINIVE